MSPLVGVIIVKKVEIRSGDVVLRLRRMYVCFNITMCITHTDVLSGVCH